MQLQILILLLGLCPIIITTDISPEDLEMMNYIEASYKQGIIHPLNFTVIANATVELICPTKKAHAHVHWLKLSRMHQQGDFILDNITTSYKLTLNNVTKYHEGWYECRWKCSESLSCQYSTHLTVLETLSLKDNIIPLQEDFFCKTYFYEEQTVSLTLLWRDELGHAAAELLRIVLATAGYYLDLIKVDRYDSASSHIFDVTTTTFVSEVHHVFLQAKIPQTTTMSCDISNQGLVRDLSDLPKSYLPLACSLYENLKRNFISSKGSRLYIYVDKMKYKLINRLMYSYNANNVLLIPVARSKLTNMIINSNESFLFIDTHQYNNMTNIWQIDISALLEKKITEISIDFVAFKEMTNSYSYDQYFNFFPRLYYNLYGIIDEFNSINKRNMEEAATRWLLKFEGYKNRREDFFYWQKKLLLPTNKYRIAVILCKSEILDLTEYLYLVKLLKNSDTPSMTFLKSVVFQVIFIDCAKTDWLVNKLDTWNKYRILLRHTVLVAVFVSHNLAVSAAPFAKKFGVPLYIYDLTNIDVAEHPAIHAAGGSVEHLVLALRRLLADCRWRRLVIISDLTNIGLAVRAALRTSATELIVRDANITSTSDIQGALRELIKADSRVFLVNAGATLAAAVLSAANELNMTHQNGYGWIVREYNASDSFTSTTKPVSVSFTWRGKNFRNKDIERMKTSTTANNKSEAYYNISNKEVLMNLNDKWQNRTWPLYAAPLLDVRYYYFAEYYAKTHEPFSKLKKMDPLVLFVQQWGSEPRPNVLTTWNAGDWRKSGETCPIVNSPPDGSSTCLLPTGDPFHPSCYDVLWFTFGIIGTIVTIVAIYWLRKSVTGYMIRMKHELTKQILTRRERVFEALTDHIVDRTALELFQELGTGRFGRVYEGILREMDGRRRNIVVAVKVLREDASSAEESEFLREACTLVTLNHENIIRFVGVCVIGPPLLLMEHAFFGDLSKYLKARRCLLEHPENTVTTNCFPDDEKVHVSAKALTALAREAATALAYLAERGIVHRDLRASNCLLDENRSLKVGDFGLARATGTDCDEYQMSRRGMVPVLWMAPESLARGVSSAASDVWSLGVLVSELVTLGRRPYGVQPPAVVLRHVLAGGQPQLPWDASAGTRALTRACWRREPEARPPAARLAAWLRAHPAALRPALVEELVYIDKLISDHDHVYDTELRPLADSNYHSPSDAQSTQNQIN